MAVARIRPEAERHSASAHGLGELHGRSLPSALMRSRVHNRTCDRGDKPIRLGVGRGHCPRSFRKDRGLSLVRRAASRDRNRKCALLPCHRRESRMPLRSIEQAHMVSCAVQMLTSPNPYI